MKRFWKNGIAIFAYKRIYFSLPKVCRLEKGREIITLKSTEISSQDILGENGVGNAEQEENSQDNGGKVPVNTTEEAIFFCVQK